MIPELPASAPRVQALRPTTAVPIVIDPPAARKSLPAGLPAMATGTDGNAKNVDWARFTATVQSAIRKTEH
jgi:hypothetical protein